MALFDKKSRGGQIFTVAIAAWMLFFPLTHAQEKVPLTVDQIMNDIIAPMTAVIWGAYQIKTDEQWQALESATTSVIEAGNLLMTTGTDSANPDWQDFNQQMIVAAQAVLVAIKNKNEEALLNAGNDQLYPPCESCHQKYVSR